MTPSREKEKTKHVALIQRSHSNAAAFVGLHGEIRRRVAPDNAHVLAGADKPLYVFPAQAGRCFDEDFQ